LFGVAGINRLLEEMLGERRFDELRIPAALTAVDLYSGREVVLKDGRVADAVLATIALPGVFPPVKWEGRFLVDGGVLDPVPVAPARALAPTKPVAAVVLSLWDGGPTETLGPATMIRNVPLLGQIARLRVAQALNIFLHSLELGSNYITELRLQIDQPDVVIRPEVGDIGLLDRVDVDELVTRGEEAGQAALPELKRAYGWRSRLSRFIKPRPEYKIRVQTES
jgi:NTE family protein